MTWDKIYEAADGAAFGEFELKRKDKARAEVVGFVKDNFGYDLEREYEEGLIESVEDWIDYFTDEYEIYFDKDGNIYSHLGITLQDKAKELLSFYYGLPDRNDKDFDTLDIALDILEELSGRK